MGLKKDMTKVCEAHVGGRMVEGQGQSVVYICTYVSVETLPFPHLHVKKASVAAAPFTCCHLPSQEGSLPSVLQKRKVYSEKRREDFVVTLGGGKRGRH